MGCFLRRFTRSPEERVVRRASVGSLFLRVSLDERAKWPKTLLTIELRGEVWVSVLTRYDAFGIRHVREATATSIIAQKQISSRQKKKKTHGFTKQQSQDNEQMTRTLMENGKLQQSSQAGGRHEYCCSVRLLQQGGAKNEAIANQDPPTTVRTHGQRGHLSLPTSNDLSCLYARNICPLPLTHPRHGGSSYRYSPSAPQLDKKNHSQGNRK